MTQQSVERTEVDRKIPHPVSTVHTFSDAGTSEHPDGVVLGNDKLSKGIQEIYINYLNTGETYDSKATVVDIYFAESIAESLHKIQNLSPWQSARGSFYYDKWKKAIDAELASLAK